MKKARIGVIGIGSMGGNHVRTLTQIEQCILVSIAEKNTDNLKKISSQYNVKAYTDHKKMLFNEKLDGVVIAVPTNLHYEIALSVIEKEVSLLVEKPLAASVEECQRLIDIAKHKKIIFGVGHVERFNPVIKEIKKKLNTNVLGKVFQIVIRRIGPYPQRTMDVGVILDLATHDIDIMLHLTNSKIRHAYSETNKVLNSRHEDLATSLLRFENNTLGVLIENWLSPTKIRDIYINGEKGMLYADFITQDLFFYENNYTPSSWGSLEVFRGMAEGNMTRFYIKKEEPLKIELKNFIDAILNRKKFMISANDGLTVVRIAFDLLKDANRI